MNTMCMDRRPPPTPTIDGPFHEPPHNVHAMTTRSPGRLRHPPPRTCRLGSSTHTKIRRNTTVQCPATPSYRSGIHAENHPATQRPTSNRTVRSQIH